jgi:hypothetical protein
MEWGSGQRPAPPTNVPQHFAGTTNYAAASMASKPDPMGRIHLAVVC